MIWFLMAGSAWAQKTDTVTLANGDHITGEVKSLSRGQLEYKTDDIGTIYFEWDKVVSLASTRLFDVTTTDGRRFFGSLVARDPRALLVVYPMSDDITLPMLDVAEIRPIGTSLWTKLDGSLDIGFSYTKSSDISQLNFNSSTVYRRPAFEGHLDASATLTANGNDGERDDRGSLQLSYLRFRGQRLFIAAGAGLESNESLGLLLRSQVGLSAGPRLVNNNRAQLAIGFGLSANDERNVNAEPTQNIEGLFTLRQSYYRYDRPKTNIDVAFQYYPSLSNWGRQRLQLNASARRELLKDFFLAVNTFDTFDSRPPTPDAAKNDVGVSLSIGWSY